MQFEFILQQAGEVAADPVPAMLALNLAAIIWIALFRTPAPEHEEPKAPKFENAPQEPAPPKLQPSVGPFNIAVSFDDLRLEAPNFSDTTSTGDFGEVIVAILLAAEGWLLIPSKYSAIHGIDGIFVRPTDDSEASRTEFLFVEVKTTAKETQSDGGVRSDQLSNEKLLDSLTRLEKKSSKLSPATIDALKYAVKSGSYFLRRQRWGVSVVKDNWWITVTDIGPSGEQLMWRKRVKTSDMAVMQALAAHLGNYYEDAPKSGNIKSSATTDNSIALTDEEALTA